MEQFHAGERAVQSRAGVERIAQRVGQSIQASIPPVAQGFIQAQALVVVGSTDAHGRVWASLLTGKPPFMEAVSDRVIRIDAMPLAGDPLAENIAVPGAIGLLAIDFATRRRMRVNGTAEVSQDGSLYVYADQVYSNCPKYIQERHLDLIDQQSSPSVQRGDQLTEAQQRWIGLADTLFIASTHPQGGADVSHRGGNPGFVRVRDARTLIFPDYAGNSMFQTLGNLVEHPACGLLLIDWERGAVLQMTGQALIHWDEEIVAQFVGAQRVLEFTVEAVIEHRHALPLRAQSVSYSPFNPG
jgi:uncharacterized protein